MSKKPVRSALGRGLSALISSTSIPVPIHAQAISIQATDGQAAREIALSTQSPSDGSSDVASVRYIPITQVIPNPTQPRQQFAEEELRELSESIRTLGVLQPVLLRPAKEAGFYEIVAGERRWRASKLAGIEQIPAVIRDLGEKETLEIALVENIQRSDLNPIEEAIAYQRLIDEFSLTQQEVADRIGKDRASVANHIRLLKLPPEILDMVRNGQLSVGHAKAILAIKEPAAQLSLARKTIAENLSVRALETIVSRVVVLDAGKTSTLKGGPISNQKQGVKGGSFPEVVDRLRNALGTKVVIKHHPSGRGRVEIDYFSEQELDRVVERICG